VAQMSFTITALLGVAMFHERLDIRKCIGLAVAAVALVLFAFG
jgi:multidrug transporter EmrE-like cation transporter